MQWLEVATCGAKCHELPSENGPLQNDVRSTFKEWAAHHGKTYREGSSEFEQRLVHWKDNIAALLEGKQESPAIVAVNSLMDMPDDEFKQSNLGQSKRNVEKEPK